MNDVRESLVDCFTAVFPTLKSEEALTATVDTVPGWDSGTHMVLLQVIEEQFRIKIPLDVLAAIDSFGAFERYLAQIKNQ